MSLHFRERKVDEVVLCRMLWSSNGSQAGRKRHPVTNTSWLYRLLPWEKRRGEGAVTPGLTEDTAQDTTLQYGYIQPLPVLPHHDLRGLVSILTDYTASSQLLTHFGSHPLSSWSLLHGNDSKEMGTAILDTNFVILVEDHISTRGYRSIRPISSIEVIPNRTRVPKINHFIQVSCELSVSAKEAMGLLYLAVCTCVPPPPLSTFQLQRLVWTRSFYRDLNHGLDVPMKGWPKRPCYGRNIAPAKRIIKSRKLRWEVYAARMEESRTVFMVLTGKPNGKKLVGRLRPTGECLTTSDGGATVGARSSRSTLN
uniref:Uncharacterized protein n=1 Tax=Timema douglasi TaxID=61478 RepID=A0A7R8Z5L9_TIMDO|nr:unnamed protein product [Timema douglasi]